MRRIIKICGLRTPATLDAALGAGADMVGFVFFPPSPRHVDPAAARALGAQVAGRARKVAAVRAVFAADERVLTDDEVDADVARLVSAAITAHGARLRS